MARKVAALIVIFIGCSIGWFALGSSVLYRTRFYDANLEQKVRLLWGGEHWQTAPVITYVVRKPQEQEEISPDGTKKVKIVYIAEDVAVPLESSDIAVKLFYEPRKKGLLWYGTYRVRFDARYGFRNPTAEKQPMTVRFSFPSSEAQYDDFQLVGPDGPLAAASVGAGVTFTTELDPGERFEFRISYRSRGLARWVYKFAPQQGYGYGAGGAAVTEVRSFRLVMDTDFPRIDFPEGNMSPNTKTRSGEGWRLVWKYSRLVTGQTIGLQLPEEINPGPLASRITFFAPVSLLFFLFILFIVCVLRGVALHPMHYFFLSLSFFAFHLLFAYLVDHVEVHAAFLVSSAASIALVVSYIRIVAGARFAFVETGLLQLVYLVLFSYSHFFEGYTGLIVTVFAVLTLFVVMQLTARVKWDEVFRR